MTSDDSTMSFRLAWTGHRALARPRLIANAVDAVVVHLRDALHADAVVGQGAGGAGLRGIGSLASGADLIVAETFARLGIAFDVVLPFEPSRCRAELREPDERSFDLLIAVAASVEVVSALSDDDAAHVECNRRVLERADGLMAVWDEEPARGPGGTGEMVRLASAVVPVVTIHAMSGAVAVGGAGAGERDTRAWEALKEMGSAGE